MSIAKPVDCGDGKIASVPLVIGVVGHNKLTNDVEQLEAISESVSNFFRILKERYRFTPIVVLSSLAEGADQIVAREAIRAQFSVRSPLPFPREVYAGSTSFTDPETSNRFLTWTGPENIPAFDEPPPKGPGLGDPPTPGNIAAFDETLPNGQDPDDLAIRGKATAFVVPLPNGPDPDDPATCSDWEKMRDDKEQRDKCYSNTGGYIVRHSMALIALWDGKSGYPAGTHDMVEFKLSGKVPECFPWRRPLEIGSERGPVVVVRTPRKNQNNNEGAGQICVLVSTKLEEGPKPIGARLRELGSWVARTSGASVQRVRNRLRLPRFVDERDEFWAQMSGTLGTDGFQVEEVPKSVWEHPPGAFAMFWHRLLGALGVSLDSSASKEFWKYRETVRNIDDFNFDLAEAAPDITRAISSATERLLRRSEADMEVHQVDGVADVWCHLGDKPEFHRLAAVRAAASFLAISLGKQLERYLLALFLTIFVALSFFHLYAHPPHNPRGETTHWPVWLWLFLLSLVSTAIIVGYVWYQRLDVRRLDYRALAEAIRVRYFWGLVGITESVADTYLRHLRDEMSWARRALYAIAPPPAKWRQIFQNRSVAEQRECFQCVVERWVSEQKKYFLKRHRHHHRWAIRLRVLGLALALIGWGMCTWLLVRDWLPASSSVPASRAARNEANRDAPARVHANIVPVQAVGADMASLDSHTGHNVRKPEIWVLIVSSLLVISGGLLVAYCERRAHESMARQYENMHVIFGYAEKELRGHLLNDDWESASRVIKDLGREALVEQVHWLVLHRARPFELVLGG